MSEAMHLDLVIQRRTKPSHYFNEAQSIVNGIRKGDKCINKYIVVN